MANRFTTKINMNDGRKKGKPGSRKQVSRMELAAMNSPRARFQAIKKYRVSKATRQKLKKIGLLVLGLLLIVGIIGGIWFFSYLQKINDELPPVENPFRDKELTSVIYDRNGTELYKLFNNFNRDSVDITQIPERVKWAFLAAEDIDFYNHQGFDPAAIVRCGIKYISPSKGSTCGGSTITQQMVKITTDQTAPTLERKIRELLFAVKIEQAYTKDQILQMYLTVAPFGSTLYGITTASQFYFGKAPKDLTLAEAAILASIVQNPVYLSPTIGTNAEAQQKSVKDRQMYVLGQMKNYENKINDQTRKNTDNPELEDVVTDEMIEAAKTEELHYRAPIFTNKKAGNFVDYALDQLQRRNYKDGQEPFTLSELQTGGYKIYTTIDYDLQKIAEQSVKDAVATYGPTYDFSNAALETTIPSTGEIITMVGSKDYTGGSEGCDDNGKNCRFNGQVNVLANQRSPGSSTKPFGTYEAYAEGKMFSGSVLPDVPIDVGGGYSVKNWNGTYMGISAQTTTGNMLRISRNLPALIVLQSIGIPKFLQTLRTFGYSTFNNDAQFGPSVILGGSGVIGIEHAQAYGVFANGGDLVKHEVISKIVDRSGKTVYEYKPVRTRVADERAVYMLNETLLNNHVLSWDGRDLAAKSGTSEDSTDAWIMMWSPDFVSVAWIGNNNSQHMNFNAFGESAVAPWIKNYMRQIGDSKYFSQATSFPRPAGITEGGGCPNNDCSNVAGEFQGTSSGFMMSDVKVPVDNIRTKIRVCKDQTDRLARPVDEALGMAQDAYAVKYVIAAPSYQQYVDKYMQEQADQGQGLPNGGPNKYCDKDRSGSGNTTNPFMTGYAVAPAGEAPYTMNFKGNAYTPVAETPVTKVDFYFDTTTPNASKLLGSITTGFTPFDQTYSVPAQYNHDSGTYKTLAVVTDSAGHTGSYVSNVVLNAVSPSTVLNITGTTTFTYDKIIALNNQRGFTFNYTGAVAPLANVTLRIKKDGVDQTPIVLCASACGASYSYVIGGSGNYAFENAGPGNTRTYVIYVSAGKGLTGTLNTAPITVTVNGS